MYAVQPIGPDQFVHQQIKVQKRVKTLLNEWMYAVQPKLVLISSHIIELESRVKKYAVQPSGPGQNILGTLSKVRSPAQRVLVSSHLYELGMIFKPIKVHAVQAEQVSTYTHELCLSEGLIERNSHKVDTIP
jgi:hypothetical protein